MDNEKYNKIAKIIQDKIEEKQFISSMLSIIFLAIIYIILYDQIILDTNSLSILVKIFIFIIISFSFCFFSIMIISYFSLKYTDLNLEENIKILNFLKKEIQLKILAYLEAKTLEYDFYNNASTLEEEGILDIERLNTKYPNLKKYIDTIGEKGINKISIYVNIYNKNNIISNKEIYSKLEKELYNIFEKETFSLFGKQNIEELEEKLKELENLNSIFKEKEISVIKEKIKFLNKNSKK